MSINQTVMDYCCHLITCPNKVDSIDDAKRKKISMYSLISWRGVVFLTHRHPKINIYKDR